MATETNEPTWIVSLRDGSKALIRPLVPSDEPYLRAGFEHLSPRSKELRFLTSSVHPNDSDYAYLLHPDGTNHLALAMERYPIDPDHRVGIGVVRCVRLAERPDEAELAITVADECHHLGAGTALMHAMNDYARSRGIVRYWGLVRMDNEAIVALLSKTTIPRERRIYEPGVYETTWELPPASS